MTDANSEFEICLNANGNVVGDLFFFMAYWYIGTRSRKYIRSALSRSQQPETLSFVLGQHGCFECTSRDEFSYDEIGAIRKLAKLAGYAKDVECLAFDAISECPDAASTAGILFGFGAQYYNNVLCVVNGGRWEICSEDLRGSRMNFAFSYKMIERTAQALSCVMDQRFQDYIACVEKLDIQISNSPVVVRSIARTDLYNEKEIESMLGRVEHLLEMAVVFMLSGVKKRFEE